MALAVVFSSGHLRITWGSLKNDTHTPGAQQASCIRMTGEKGLRGRNYSSQGSPEKLKQ